MRRILYALAIIAIIAEPASAFRGRRARCRGGSCAPARSPAIGAGQACGPGGCGPVQYGAPAWSATAEPSVRGEMTLEPPETFTGGCQGGSCQPARRGRR